MTKDELIEAIVDSELAMFLSVPTDRTYSCRQHPEAFKLHRRAQFSVWSVDTLSSYLDDLRQAITKGENLMTVKYARMQGLIAKEHVNPLIDTIETIQVQWQRELIERYPHLMAGARPLGHQDDSAGTGFETYLRGELETYSGATLDLLYHDLFVYQRQGVNASEKIYEYLVQRLGYASIEEAERVRKRG
jgi:hypothetical protein